MTQIQCPHCETYNCFPEGDYDDYCGSCGDDMNRIPDSYDTGENEETAPEVAPSETAKSFDSGSITTAYLARSSQNTGHTYGTWSETDLPVGDHIRLIIPTKDARQMFADGALLVRLNEECVRAQSAEFRKQREKKQAEERERIRRAISREVQEELFAEELATIDAQAAAIYAQIDQLVDERLGADK